MHAYRMFLLNDGGEIVSEREMYCVDDDEASSRADAQATLESYAIELWKSSEFVRRVEPAVSTSDVAA